MVELLLARFQGPPKNGCYSFWAFFFFLFFLFLLHVARGCSKKTYFRYFAHPSKASSNIMQQQWSKPKPPPKKVRIVFSETPFLTNFSKNTNFAPPPENCAQNISKNPIFIGSKKVAKLLTLRWPSHWPWNGQVVAKLWLYIYIHVCVCVCVLWCFYLGQLWPFEVLLSGPSLLFTKHCLSKSL